MEPYESFSCRCERGDVVLRKSHKPHSFGRLYYACPLSKPSKQDHGCGYFKWKDEITFGNASSFLKPSTPLISSSCASYSLGLSGDALSPGNAECSNCKILTMKIKIPEARLAMERHPEDHACQSAAILHELLNEMENIRVE
ncbi:integrase, catalytic region, zinc finger, CCHC-type containing protein [Tanacetum coccineum]